MHKTRYTGRPHSLVDRWNVIYIILFYYVRCATRVVTVSSSVIVILPTDIFIGPLLLLFIINIFVFIIITRVSVWLINSSARYDIVDRPKTVRSRKRPLSARWLLKRRNRCPSPLAFVAWHTDTVVSDAAIPTVGRTRKVVLTSVVVEFFRIAVSSVLRHGWYCYKFGLFRRVIDAIFSCARLAMEEEERNYLFSCKQRTYALAITVVLMLSTITCCECRKFLEQPYSQNCFLMFMSFYVHRVLSGSSVHYPAIVY